MALFFVFVIFFCLINYSEELLSSKYTVHNLTNPETIEFNGSNNGELNIFCIKGLPFSIYAIWSSSYLYFINEPSKYKVFYHNDIKKLADDHKNSWMPFLSLTNYFPTKTFNFNSFNFNCIGIATSDPFEIEFVQKNFCLWKFLIFCFGLILFKFANEISRNSLFYYGSCTSIGIVASLLILVFLLIRFVPKKGAYLIALFGSSAALLAAQIIWNNLHVLLVSYKEYLLLYCGVAALISFCISYIYGPVTNIRTLNLMQWGLQLIGLSLIFISSDLLEFSLFITSLILLLHNFNFLGFLKRKFWYNKCTKLRRLNKTEFQKQGEVETRKALEDLKKYCKSPDCNAWKMICKLKDPIRFAKFIEGDSHISDNEFSLHESSTLHNNLSSTDLIITDDDSDSDSSIEIE